MAYNTATEQAELREGADRDLHSGNVTSLDDITNMEKNLAALNAIIFDVMFAAPQERASRCQQGAQRVRTLPNEARSQPESTTIQSRPTILAGGSQRPRT
jgi:hypothetical protein